MEYMHTPNKLTDDNSDTSQIFNAYGGYFLGMHIAEKLSDVYDFNIPRQIVYQSIDTIDHKEIIECFSLGFGVKTSGIEESFSAKSARGVNSSRHSFWSGDDYDEGKRIIDTAIKRLSSGHMKALVFQEYIKGSRVNMHVKESEIVCETDRLIDRLLVQRKSAEYTCETVSTESPQQPIPTDLLDKIIESATPMRKELGFDYDIELMVSDNGPYITQLRPIPNRDCIHFYKNEPFDHKTVKIHETRYTNGIWSTGRFHEVDKYTEKEPFVVIKKNKDIRRCGDVRDALNEGTPTLVLDPFSGFRLTHEPRNLPEELRIRRYFGYLSIASCNRTIDSGQVIYANLNEDIGTLYEAD
jgi:hypothetical protein